RAGFLARRAGVRPGRQAAAVPSWKTYYQTTTGWAIMVCLFGVAGTFLRWAEVHTSWGHVYANAFSSWQGITVAGTYLVLGSLLITTYSSGPVAAWKPAALLTAAGILLVALLLYADRLGRIETTLTVTTSIGVKQSISGEPRTAYAILLEGIYVQFAC